MSFIAREIEKLSRALCTDQQRPDYKELYAAQQALSWALDPKAFKAPYLTIMGTQGGSEDCSVDIRHSPLPDNSAAKSGVV